MSRRLFTLASAVSLLLCAGAILVMALGGVTVGRLNALSEPRQFSLTYTISDDMGYLDWPTIDELVRIPGIRFSRMHDPPPLDVYLAEISKWWVAPSIVLPVAWGVTAIFSRRIRPSIFCSLCAYDLRATPERCPECGTPAQPNVTLHNKSR